MLTNFKTIRQSIKRLADLEEMTGENSSRDFTKKELLKLGRERDKLERALGGIKLMDSLPDAIFVVDVGHEEIAVREANKLGIPVIAVVDTNCSPGAVDYAIPGNDDAMRAIKLYAEGVADAVLDGKASIPEVLTGDDEFVELDAEGKPLDAKKRRAKKAAKKKAKVTRKASQGEAAPAANADASPGKAADAADADATSTDEAAPAAEVEASDDAEKVSDTKEKVSDTEEKVSDTSEDADKKD
jgi:small subunit ribosomal protein S2